MTSWKSKILVLIASSLLIACTSKISQENYNKITTEMSYADVEKILGKPTNTNQLAFGEISAATAIWEGKKGKVVIQFLNDKVKLKNFSGSGVEKIEIE